MKPIPASSIEVFRRDPKQYQAVKDLLDGVNGTRRALERGDYAERPQYGRWDVVSCLPWGMRDGTTAPGWGPFRGVSTPYFGVNATMSGGVVVPASMVPEGGLWPTLRFSYAAGPTAGETVQWQLTLTVAGRDRNFPAQATVVAPYTAQVGDLYLDRATRFPPIPFAVNPLDAVLVEVKRLSTATTQNPYLLGVDFAFQRGTFGAEARP